MSMVMVILLMMVLLLMIVLLVVLLSIDLGIVDWRSMFFVVAMCVCLTMRMVVIVHLIRRIVVVLLACIALTLELLLASSLLMRVVVDRNVRAAHIWDFRQGLGGIDWL